MLKEISPWTENYISEIKPDHIRQWFSRGDPQTTSIRMTRDIKMHISKSHSRPIKSEWGRGRKEGEY